MARLGRPPNAPKDRRTRICTVKATPAEAKRLRKLANAAGLPLAAYLRQRGLSPS